MTDSKTDAALLLTVGTVLGISALVLLRFGSYSASINVAVIVLVWLPSLLLIFACWWFTIRGLVLAVRVAIRESDYSQ
ncbi:hypothetical protein [Halalkalicoccus jeotgali]|uniref:hypothetical protein n=1 Tax=Halalkalicoccus jeotgali TaxID=413810 RepID=UPI00067808C1|nr:hypothetical protein [Halalkalicoccus jeotgali]